MNKSTLLARNAKVPTKLPKEFDEIPWEGFVDREVGVRREPWRQLEENLGKSWDDSQSAQNTTSVTPGGAGTTDGATVPSHTHAPSDIQAQFITLNVVTGVSDDGVNLVYKTRQLTFMATASEDESGWTTFAQTVTSCDE